MSLAAGQTEAGPETKVTTEEPKKVTTTDTGADSKGAAGAGDEGKPSSKDFFGLNKGKGNPDSGAAGDKSQVTQQDGKKPESGPGTEAKPKDRLLAGKYKSIEDLEGGYGTLHSESTRLQQSVKVKDDQIAKLTAELTTLKGGSDGAKVETGKPGSTEKAGAPLKALWEPAVGKLREQVGDDLADSLTQVFQQYDSRLEELGKPSPDEIARQEAFERDRTLHAFREKYPDVSKEAIDGMTALAEEIQSEAAKADGDPVRMLELFHWANIGRNLPAMLKEAEARIEKEVEKRLRNQGLAGSLSHGGRGRSAPVDGEKQQTSREFFGVEKS